MADTNVNDTGPAERPRSAAASVARRSTARERLLDAAATRFYSDGVSATGIDAIVTDAGVAKMSLYNNFSSKADLVRAYLDARHGQWLGLYRERLEEVRDGRGGVLAVFDAYADHATVSAPQGFRGCGLFNAASELPAGHEGRAVVRRHKEEVEAMLVGHLERVVPGRPDEARAVGEHLSFLLEGAMARAGLEHTGARLARARAIAVDLLDRLQDQR